MSKIEGIIDADLHSRSLVMNRKSAVKVSVPHADNLIDLDDLQMQKFAIKQRVCEDVICV